ncbi:MAG: hypothetical protein HFI86_05700 [Bacilli bacterium]|nr:hypothetical protein [Bacilli bacterium]
MDFLKELKELKEMALDIYVNENYIKGNIDKFINNWNVSTVDKSFDLTDIILNEESESTKKYLKKITDIHRKIGLVEKVLTTKKLESNRTDLIKIGAEMLKIAQELIEIGKGEF